MLYIPECIERVVIHYLTQRKLFSVYDYVYMLYGIGLYNVSYVSLYGVNIKMLTDKSCRVQILNTRSCHWKIVLFFLYVVGSSLYICTIISNV